LDYRLVGLGNFGDRGFSFSRAGKLIELELELAAGGRNVAGCAEAV
jgi:hypothetical protein